jgi:hypothetical protein
MQCPSCRFEQPDANEACEACGLIFAKWRERHQAPAPSPVEDPVPGTNAPSEGPALENAASTEGPAPEQKPPENPWKKPLPEREYHQFPVVKAAVLSTALIAGAIAYVVLSPSSKEGYATPKPIPLPTSIAGSANPESSPYPTETPFPCGYPEATCTPTPIPTPKTIPGAPWQYHGKILDRVHLSTISGVQIVFSNNGVAVTATSSDKGFYQISVPPLSGTEAYEVQLSHPSFREGYWTDDPSALSQNDRLASIYDEPPIQHLRGQDGGGGENLLDLSMFPYQLNEQEQMYLQNIHPPSRP